MRLTALTLTLALGAGVVQAAPVTVVEVSESGGMPRAEARGNVVNTDMYFMLQQLQDEVRSLRGTIEQQQYRLDRLEQQQLDRYRDMDKRISILFQQLPGAAAALPAADVSGTAVAPETSAELDSPVAAQAVKQQTASVPESSPVGSMDEQSEYDAAFAKVRTREFDTAEKMFKRFISDYPSSTLQANAWYWLGEVYLAQQKIEGARSAFGHVVEQFRMHTKAADALYKLGVLAGRAGDEVKASELMHKVVQDYPQAPAAELARGYLKP